MSPEFDESLPDDPFSKTDSPGPPEEEEGTEMSNQPIGAGGGINDIISRLFDGGVSGPAVDELRAEYGLPSSWSIALRGTLRTATGSGVPPVAEILIGSLMGIYGRANAGSDSSAEEEGGGVGEMADQSGGGSMPPEMM